MGTKEVEYASVILQQMQASAIMEDWFERLMQLPCVTEKRIKVSGLVHEELLVEGQKADVAEFQAASSKLWVQVIKSRKGPRTPLDFTCVGAEHGYETKRV